MADKFPQLTPRERTIVKAGLQGSFFRIGRKWRQKGDRQGVTADAMGRLLAMRLFENSGRTPKGTACLALSDFGGTVARALTKKREARP